MATSAVNSFIQSDLYQKGVPRSRVSRHGAPVSNPAVRKGQDYLRWAIKKFINGQTPNQYDYSKLEPDEIRLLQLRPAPKAEAPIFCIMFKAKRQDVVNGYEALSYSWGDIPRVHHPIYIDDKNPPIKEPKKDLWQAVVKVGHWQDRVKRNRREERRKELEKQLSESHPPENDRQKLEVELRTLQEFHNLDEEQEHMKKEWEQFKENSTLDPITKANEQKRLKEKGDELIRKGEELDKRYNEMSKGIQDKDGEQSIPVHMITERRKQILDKTQQPRGAPNPESTVQEFHVRPNLYTALMHLRTADRPVNIWVDAICINQQKDGEKEKEEQLARMAEIYGNASNVCIWLGDSDTHVKGTLNFIQQMMDFSQLDKLFENLDSKPLARTSALSFEGDGQQQLSGSTNNSVTNNDLVKDLSKSQWYNLMRLLRFPWFSRRWIIQEIGMAKDASVHIGEHVLHWDDLCDAINLLNEKADDLRNKTRDHDEFGDIEGLSASTLVKVIGNACGKDERGGVTTKLMNLETLVCSLLAFDSFHAYDAIYSLLSLAADVDIEKDDDPDYTINANFKRSTRDLFISFVRRSIIKTQSLDIICRHWAPQVKNDINEIMILPSWVSGMERSPYGHPSNAHGRQHGENFVGFYNGDTRRRYNASADTTPAFSIAKLATSKTPRKKQEPIRAGSTIVEESDNVLSPTRSKNAPPAMHLSSGHPMSFSDLPMVSSPTDRPQDDPMKSTQSAPEVDLTAVTAGSSPHEDKSPELPKTTAVSGVVGATSANSGEGRTTQQASPQKAPVINANASPPASTRTAVPVVLAKQARMKKRAPHPPANDTANQPRRGTTVSDKKDRLSGILSTQGFCIGTINDISGAMDSVVDGKWVRKLGWVSSAYNGNQVPDVLWRTLVADRGPDGGFAPHWYRRACLHVLADPKITDSHGYIKVSKYATRILGEMTARYLRRVDTVTLKRSIFSCKSRLNPPEAYTSEVVFGLAPELAKRHDLVCILFGCSVPVILREITGGGNDDHGKYELIGEAYVHGKMQGEAVKEWTKLGKEAQTFQIA